MFSEIVDKLRDEVRAYQTQGRDNLKEAIQKAECMEPLSPEDLGSLVTATDEEDKRRILCASKNVTRGNLGNNIGLIAPLYIDNHCNNKCRYCGMSKNNSRLERRRIESVEEFSREVELLRLFGYFTVELVAGGCAIDVDKVNKYLDIMEMSGIENTAFFFDTLSEEVYQSLCSKHPHVTMVHWQETYIQERYIKYHPVDTPKGDYGRRLNAIETAFVGGLEKYAIGVLFGLADPREDVLMCIGHGRYLEEKYGHTPRAVGIVRLQPTNGAEIVGMPCPVDEEAHLFFSAILRLAFPKSEMIATTRENADHIRRLLLHAATFTNATCTTVPGGYSDKFRDGIQTDGQFYHNSPSCLAVRKMVEGLDLCFDPRRAL